LTRVLHFRGRDDEALANLAWARKRSPEDPRVLEEFAEIAAAHQEEVETTSGTSWKECSESLLFSPQYERPRGRRGDTKRGGREGREISSNPTLLLLASLPLLRLGLLFWLPSFSIDQSSPSDSLPS